MRRGHRRAHRAIWILLAIALPLILLGTMAARRVGPLEAASVRIAPP